MYGCVKVCTYVCVWAGGWVGVVWVGGWVGVLSSIKDCVISLLGNRLHSERKSVRAYVSIRIRMLTYA
jgi:hypothetical protein